MGGTVPVPTRHASRPPLIRWEKTTAVAVKIKLKRLGKIRAPYYRIVVADSRTKRDGRAIEEIGKYHPKADPSFIEVDSERAQHWLSVGAQPTDPVRKIFEVTGDWQKFKGLPGAEGTLQTAAARADKKVAFAAAVAETVTDGATTPKARGKARAADAKTADTKAADAKAGGAKAGGAKTAETKAADTKPADAKAADTKPADAKAADTKPADAKAGGAKAADDKPAKVAKTAAAEGDAAAESAAAPTAEETAADTAAAAEKPAKAKTAKASAKAADAAESAAEPAAASDEAAVEESAEAGGEG
jgi:small subunit ribosomal protein S16